MKISKSKQELARIIRENGGWRNGEFAAQDGDGEVGGYSEKPQRSPAEKYWFNCAVSIWFVTGKVANYYQTTLSRAEYLHLYPSPDADDGWIEWSGGECPVDKDARIDIRMTGGKTYYDTDTHWGWNADSFKITHYRLHRKEKSKSEFCESVMRTIPELEAKPTIEQLAADYRNKPDYANRKQDEADKANMESDAALAQLEDAIAEIGFAITPLAATEKETELVITDWRDLRVGDEIEVFNFEWPERESRCKQELMSGPCVVMRADGGNVRIELKKNLPTKGSHWNATGVDACEFKFIRRP